LRKKKLLILTDWFAPGYKAGGPIQSCVNLCAALNKDYDIYVLTTDTDHGESEPYPGIVPDTWIVNQQLNVQVCYLKSSELSARIIKQRIAETQTDIIYLNHLFSPLFVVYPLWLKLTGKLAAKTVVCPRGALYESALSLKRYKKQPLLKLYRWMGITKKVVFHATNQREKDAILQHFPGSRVLIADNLPDTNQQPFITLAKEKGTVKCIFIARIVPIKNLLFLLRLLQTVKSNITLTIAGPAENEAYWNECKAVIKRLPENVHTNYIGSQEKSKLHGIIQQHHLYISPTTGENFGHAIFEALLAGRPVLISDQTPWLQLEKEHAGWDLSLSAPEKFLSVIETVAAFSQEEYDRYAKGAWNYAERYIHHAVHKEAYYTLF